MSRQVRTTIGVRWADLDALGHVNNAIFLTYLEEARDAFMRQTLGDVFLDMVIVRVEIDYRAEIPAGTSNVEVTCALESIGTSSIRTREQILLPDGTVAAEAMTVAVVRDREARTSRPWTDDERSALGSIDT
ncbi:MAG: hypothetical protein B7C55_12025 [Actinomycetales bacterium mxb001]|nr:MAG: hypothetical protein B7C55_12025 [Actinomycetales bacterium mxb001]